MIEITVSGVPRPQGSLKLFRNPKTGLEVAKYSAPTYEWRAKVSVAVAAGYDGPVIEGAVELSLVFRLPRPRGHYGTGKNVQQLKPSAPTYPTAMPDTDKLARAVGDAISDAGNVWRDDAQVVRLIASKVYADGEAPGCTITIRSARA